MPLSQSDPNLDYPGSWGDASEGWPKIRFRTEEEANDASVVAWRVAKVPYGSYVTVDKELRLETLELKELVERHLSNNTKIKIKQPTKENDMGWRERVMASVADLNKSGVDAQKALESSAVKADGADEVVKHLLDVQHAACEALSELYDSCGPFISPKNVKKDA